AATGQYLGLLHPVFTLDAAAETQMIVDPGALLRAPCCDLHIGIDAQLMQDALDLRADARNQLQIIRLIRTHDANRTIDIADRLFLDNGLFAELRRAQFRLLRPRRTAVPAC